MANKTDTWNSSSEKAAQYFTFITAMKLTGNALPFTRISNPTQACRELDISYLWDCYVIKAVGTGGSACATLLKSKQKITVVLLGGGPLYATTSGTEERLYNFFIFVENWVFEP